MSNFGHLSREKISLVAGVDLNNVIEVGVYSVDDPTNGPAAGDWIVDVDVAVESGGTRHVLQTAKSVADGTMQVRVYNGTVWSAWAAIGGGGAGGGTTVELEADEALAAGDFVNIFDDVGTVKVRLADASVGVALRAHGFVKDAVLLAGTATVYLSGVNDAVTGLTPGADQYLSETAGGRTETAPVDAGDIVQLLGNAITATSMYFDPNGLTFVRA